MKLYKHSTQQITQRLKIYTDKPVLETLTWLRLVQLVSTSPNWILTKWKNYRYLSKKKKQKQKKKQLECWNEMIFFTVWARNNYFKTNNISISFACRHLWYRLLWPVWAHHNIHLMNHTCTCISKTSQCQWMIFLICCMYDRNVCNYPHNTQCNLKYAN